MSVRLYAKVINDLSDEVKLISSKGLTKDLINGHSILSGTKHFSEEDGSHNYLVSQPVFKYFKTLTNNDMVMAWKPKVLSDESIKPPPTSGNSFNLRLVYFNNPKFPVEFNGSCLKPDKLFFTPYIIINLHITFKIKSSSSSAPYVLEVTMEGKRVCCFKIC